MYEITYTVLTLNETKRIIERIKSIPFNIFYSLLGKKSEFLTLIWGLDVFWKCHRSVPNSLKWAKA